MKIKNLAVLSAVTLSTALFAAWAKTAATSRIPLSSTYKTEFGGSIPIPDEYHAAARRERDEASSPQSVILYAAEDAERAWGGSARLDDGSVLVEVLPFENTSTVLKRVKRINGRMDGLAYPAFAAASPGRVSIALVTPKRLVRVSAARWTTAFDRVVRGFRDDA